MSESEENIFFRWMKNPGIVKKLQALILISMIINILLVIHILELTNQKHKQTIQSSKNSKENPEVANTTELSLDKESLKAFIKEYLDNFFKTDKEAVAFITKHTETKLFEQSLKAEIEKRKNQNLSSSFEITDSYIEGIDDHNIKALIVGQEIFTDQSYAARNISLELLIDIETLEVKAIPLFEVHS